MKLKDVRRRKLLSMRTLAKRAGVGVSTIYFIESGRSTPRLDIIEKLVNVLQIDPMEVDEFKASIEGK